MNFNFKNTNLIPHEDWIYYHYLNLDRKLNGNNIRIPSEFNNERTPSMFIYLKGGKYRWKDHSSGKGGDAIDLVKALVEHKDGSTLDFLETIKLINLEYQSWKHDKGEAFIPAKYDKSLYLYETQCLYEIREFSEADLRFWRTFGISKELLNQYGVAALEWFQIGRHFREQNYTRWGRKKVIFNSYGYFAPRTEGVRGYFYNDKGSVDTRYADIVKIYNPYESDYKHITLKKTILGSEQLNPAKNKTLIIASSMKDLLSLKSLDLNIDVIAPIGEKVLIDSGDINKLKEIYTNTLTLFDNDKAGVQAMLLYKKVYNIDFVYVPYYKDISDFRHYTSYSNVKREVTTRISRRIFKPIHLDDKEIKSEEIPTRDSEKYDFTEKNIQSRHPY